MNSATNEADASVSNSGPSKVDYSIKEYVRQRRAHPSQPRPIQTFPDGLWLLVNKPTLDKFKIPFAILNDALEAKFDAVAEVSLRLLELLVERQRMEDKGEKYVVKDGKAVSDNFVNMIIGQLLTAQKNSPLRSMPEELIVLIEHQLALNRTAIEKKTWSKLKRVMTPMIAADMVAHGETPSRRKLAERLEVDHKTIERWFPRDSLQTAMKVYLKAQEMDLVKAPLDEALIALRLAPDGD